MSGHESDVSSSDENDTNKSMQLTLTDLPIEIFLYICSFLDASTIVHRLGLVCKRFSEILRDDLMWKSRISQVWPNTRYPILPAVNDENFWKKSCVIVERQVSLWKKSHEMEHIRLENGHHGYVDSLLLMNNGRLCVSGGRDRLLICWRLDSPEHEKKIEKFTGQGHDGWIWDITSLHGKIYSCSWDKRVHEWDLTSELQLLTKFPMDITGALLCMASNPEQNLLAIGSFCKVVSVLDPRIKESLVVRYQPHKRSIMKIAMNSQYIVSASEDKTVSIWDQRKQQTMKTFRLSNVSFPMSMSLQRGAVYLGDKKGNIYVLDANENFKLTKIYKTKHTQGITGIHVTPGSIITSSLDGTVRISSATDHPRHFATIQSEAGEIASMDYSNEVLAICSNSIVQIWRSRDELECERKKKF